MELPALDHPASIADGHPYVLAKGDVLYFQSNREGRLQIFRTAEDTFGAWSKPALASGFSTDLAFSPVVTEDDMTMYFASDRGKAEEAAAAGGVPEPGDYDIWMAERPTSGEPFASPTRVEGINTTLGETPSWISPDACRLYFSRRIGNTDQSQIHMATR
jgi:Tol biopolymer transport system component